MDHQPAPTDEPEPTAAPNQSESHAQSYASAAMPTNQMIMDELSQQIHYELHRLSSRLSNMDVDEDSSELESYIILSRHIIPKERGSIHAYI
ncbi:hypothetical protein Lal_00012311 [Lupinus albus]|nr:hypothetical protein Lal_00012311 [Lupinus albus]